MPSLLVNAIKVEQPIGEFFYGKIKAKDLMDISYSDVRRLEDEERGVEKYLGIQRPLKKERVKDISSYISTVDATFPNSVIIAINEDNVVWENNKLKITFNEEEKGSIAKILDGQHRLAGFNESNYTFLDYEGEEKDFELLVTIFVKADMAVQAKIFSMVNQNQTKVNKSLVYDLESLAETRSPWKTGHNIAVYLNSNESSSFYRRIKRLGVKVHKDEQEPLTQAAFVENLVKLITPNAQEDRNIIMGKDKGFLSFSNKKLPHLDEDSLRKFVFRKLFTDDKDEYILKTVFSFFKAVEKTWEPSWDKENKASTLNKTVGLISLFRFLTLILQKHIDDYNDFEFKELDVSYFEEILGNLKIKNSYFESIDAVSKSSSQIYKYLASRF